MLGNVFLDILYGSRASKTVILNLVGAISEASRTAHGTLSSIVTFLTVMVHSFGSVPVYIK